MQKYPKIFSEWKLSTPQAVMAELNAANRIEMYTIRGLVLGLPLESVRGYEQDEDLKLNAVAERLHTLITLAPHEDEYLVNEFFGNRRDKEGLLTFFEQQLTRHAEELGIWEDDIPKLLEELKFKLEAKRVDVYGVYWMDHGDYPESQEKQARLKSAFEESGILTR